MGAALPLSGIRVVALEQAVAAPFCSRQLADMGADVIKIERPGSGDFARHYDAAILGQSAHFVWLNRGKRSVVIDLKTSAGRDACARLIKDADVFVHNLAPGGVEDFGLGYDAMRATNPRLIWCGISGYGPDGPYRDRKAYDLLIQAEAGVMSLTGTADEPAKAGVSIADIAAGLYAYSSILTALYRRERTGEGARIDISMLECLAEWATPQLYTWMGTGRLPERAGARHSTIVPYGAYPCQDGRVNLAIQNDGEWQAFCGVALQRPELAADPRFHTVAARLENRRELEAIIESQWRDEPCERVLARLHEAQIATGNLNDMSAVQHHQQLRARGRWAEVPSAAGPIPALLPPHNIQGVAPVMGRVPELGEHTAQVLAGEDRDE
ncbi:MAG: CoA transferase [Acidobacteria bacterium]|nr:CoA transferase [Acidobacteriota bacterium]